MAKDWRIVGLSGAITIVALVGFFSWFDRTSVVDSVRAVASSNARMVAAHGEVALGEAAQVVAAILPLADLPDFEDEEWSRAMHQRMQSLIIESPRLSAAWITDASGLSRVDSWNHPGIPVDNSERDDSPACRGRIRSTYRRAKYRAR
jgi:hypothetical protein